MIPLPTALLVTDVESLEEVTELAAPVAVAAERLRLVKEAAEAQKARAVGDLRHALLHLGCSVAEDECHRAKLARVLYWGYPDIPVRDVVVALSYADQRALVAAAGSVDTGIACTRCARQLVAGSRSALTDIQKESACRRRPWNSALICAECRDAQSREEAMSWARDPWPDEDAWDHDGPWEDDGFVNPAA